MMCLFCHNGKRACFIGSIRGRNENKVCKTDCKTFPALVETGDIEPRDVTGLNRVVVKKNGRVYEYWFAGRERGAPQVKGKYGTPEFWASSGSVRVQGCGARGWPHRTQIEDVAVTLTAFFNREGKSLNWSVRLRLRQPPKRCCPTQRPTTKAIDFNETINWLKHNIGPDRKIIFAPEAAFVVFRAICNLGPFTMKALWSGANCIGEWSGISGQQTFLQWRS
jgi:hypothetical protein